MHHWLGLDKRGSGMTYKRIRKWSERCDQQCEGKRGLVLALEVGLDYTAAFDASKYPSGVTIDDRA